MNSPIDKLIRKHQRFAIRSLIGEGLSEDERTQWEEIKAELDRDEMERLGPVFRRLDEICEKAERFAESVQAVVELFTPSEDAEEVENVPNVISAPLRREADPSSSSTEAVPLRTVRYRSQ